MALIKRRELYGDDFNDFILKGNNSLYRRLGDHMLQTGHDTRKNLFEEKHRQTVLLKQDSVIGQ
jgi:hypothetical protein